MANTLDKRPPVAVGHVRLPVKNVLSTSAFLQEIGLLKIFEKDTFAVLELRGGTHLILEKSRIRTKFDPDLGRNSQERRLFDGPPFSFANYPQSAAASTGCLANRVFYAGVTTSIRQENPICLM